MGAYRTDEPPVRSLDHGVVESPGITGVAVVRRFGRVLVALECHKGDVGSRAGALRNAMQLPGRDCRGGFPGSELAVRIGRLVGRGELGPGKTVISRVNPVEVGRQGDGYPVPQPDRGHL